MRFLTDGDLNNRILNGLKRRLPDLDIVRVQDPEVGLAGKEDSEVLTYAAAEDRIVLTHDENTMIAFARARIEAGLAMPGLVVIHQSLPIGEAIEDLVLLAGAGRPEDCDRQIRFLPFG